MTSLGRFRLRRQGLVLRPLQHRLAFAGQVIGAVDEGEMREGLRKIAYETFVTLIVLFA